MLLVEKKPNHAHGHPAWSTASYTANSSIVSSSNIAHETTYDAGNWESDSQLDQHVKSSDISRKVGQTPTFIWSSAL